MTLNHRKRLLWLLAIATVAGGFAFALINAFNQNMVFFYTPSQIKSGEVPSGLKSYRLGGMVQQGSVQRQAESLAVRFVVTDQSEVVTVEFAGILPDLFKEGTGVVVDGVWNGERFLAREVLAKHDENYMPPGVKP
ncbi:MAG: cytochrome c maturation protein CcmE [Limnobacter sp.]|uniref:cytochrome c maturation protein CcmE n=1 Tax=Limnobacter sp. TaxID=2003368 RepID=UPI003919D612